MPAGTELSFDYQWTGRIGSDVTCLCGAKGCRGTLGRRVDGDADEPTAPSPPLAAGPGEAPPFVSIARSADAEAARARRRALIERVEARNYSPVEDVRPVAVGSARACGFVVTADGAWLDLHATPRGGSDPAPPSSAPPSTARAVSAVRLEPMFPRAPPTPAAAAAAVPAGEGAVGAHGSGGGAASRGQKRRHAGGEGKRKGHKPRRGEVPPPPPLPAPHAAHTGLTTARARRAV